MQTLKINIPAGFEIDSFDQATGEVSFREKPKSAMERIKTIEDILADHNLTMDEVDDQFGDVPDHLKHQYIAELLCKSLNEGWEPDWNDSNQPKYYPWFEMGSSGFRFRDCDHWRTYSTVGSRLCFKSKELAQHAGKAFLGLYKKFMIIN